MRGPPVLYLFAVPGEKTRGALAAGAVLAIALVALPILTRAGWPAGDYRDRAFFSYWAASRALIGGIDPYDAAAWGALVAREGGSATATFADPPWTGALLLPLGALPFSLAAPAWLVAQCLAVAAGLAALRRRMLLSAPTRDGPVLAAFALIFQPLWQTIAGGDAGGFLFAALCGAMALLASGRAAAAGAMLGLLTVSPGSFLLLGPAFVLAAPHRRATAVGAGAVIAALALPIAALRPALLTNWMGTLGTLQASGERSVALAAALIALVAFGVWATRSRLSFESAVTAALCISLMIPPQPTPAQVTLLVAAAVIIELRARVFSGRRSLGLAALAVSLGAIPWALEFLSVRGAVDRSWFALVPAATFALILSSDRLARAGIRRRGGDAEGSQLIG